MLAGKIACANAPPSWGREHALELLDALLTLAAEHGFAQADTLREKLGTGAPTDRTRRLAEIAFEPVPATALLDVIRQSSFYIGEYAMATRQYRRLHNRDIGPRRRE